MRVMRDIARSGEGQDRRAAARPTRRREHADPATRAQLFPDTVGFRVGDISLERKIKESDRRGADREALHEARDSHPLRQSDAVRPRHLRRRGGGAPVFRARSAKDLTLEEAAMLAGIIQSPARQSPFVSVEAATRRRNYALQRMADEGYITQAEADAAKSSRSSSAASRRSRRPDRWRRTSSKRSESISNQRYGAKALYESGLAVTTTLDVKLQEAANRAVDARAAPARQTARLSPAATKRPRGRTHRRRVQGGALGAADRRRRRRAGRRRRRSASRRRQRARDCGSAAITPT